MPEFTFMKSFIFESTKQMMKGKFNLDAQLLKIQILRQNTTMRSTRRKITIKENVD